MHCRAMGLMKLVDNIFPCHAVMARMALLGNKRQYTAKQSLSNHQDPNHVEPVVQEHCSQ